MTKQLIINIEQDTYSGEYIATFDGYDGAPIDNETPSRDPIGHGKTEHDAVIDLIEMADEL